MQVIDWIVLIVLGWNTALGVKLWPKSNTGLRLVTIYFATQTVLEIWSDLLLMQHINNNFLYHFFTPILFLILSYLFSTHIKNKRLSDWILAFCVVSALICWIIAFTVQPVKEMNSYAHLITRLILCFWVVLYFGQLLFVDDYEPLIPNYMFWVCIAILIHIANYCFWGIANILYKYDHNLVSQWYSNILVLDIIFYSVLALPSYRLWYYNGRLQDAK